MKTKILFISSLLLIIGCSKPTTYEDLKLIDGFIIETYGMISRDNSWTHVPSITYKGIDKKNPDYHELGTFKEYINHNSTIIEPYTGEVSRFYTSGELLCTDTFEDGQLIDIKYFNKDSTIKDIVNYEKDLIIKDSVFYNKETNKPFSGKVISGNRKIIGRVHQGKIEGPWYEVVTNYFTIITNYKDGKKNGYFLKTNFRGFQEESFGGRFVPNIEEKYPDYFNHISGYGNLSEGYYKDDKKEGWWITRRYNGNILKEEFYKDDELDGFFRDYVNQSQMVGELTSGHYQSKGRYLNGEKIGVWLNRGGSRREPTKELEIINNVRHPDSRWYQYPYKTEK